MSLRIGVLGVGRLGEHHARLLSELPEANLVGIYDIDAQRAETIARKLGLKAYANASDLLDQVEAVTIAVPTPAHFAVATECLERGLHCLVEKPLTNTVEEAEKLIELAERKNKILQVGHVERFNPAVVEMCRHVKAPVFIEANRLGPYDPRVSHIGVVLDLMIHDLDIVLSLVKRRIERLDAIGASVFSGHEDIAKVTLFFEGGCRADIAASRISFKKFRKIRVYQHDSYISLDYSERSLRIYRRKTEQVKNLGDIKLIRPRIEKYDSLQRQLAHFIDCVQTGREPLVSGQHGRDAIELAREILKAMQVHHLPEMAGGGDAAMTKRYLIVAGDPSGDLLGANLVQAMKKIDSNIHISALGGKHLKACSERFLADLVAQHAHGFLIPLKKIRFLRHLLKKVIAPELAGSSIDEVILVDFYGFNRHVAEIARQYGKPVHYYVCPQFWASRPGRLKRIQSCIRDFLVIFPFEVEFYKARGLSATFVGHPLLDPILATSANGSQPRHVEPLIGLLPGSRPYEIKKHLPVMLAACDKIHASFPSARFILFAAPDLNSDAYANILKPGERRPYFLEIVKDENYAWRSQLDVAISSSGLETLETALLGIPMVVIYKMHWITYLIARSVITVRNIAIPNILAGRVIVPELIQHAAQPGPIADILLGWLKNPAEKERIRQELLALRKQFGNPGASDRAARVILQAA